MEDTWYGITIDALQEVWRGFLGFIPDLVAATVVFIVGWFVSVGIGRLITEILRKIKFDQLFENTGWTEALEKAEMKVDVSKFAGAIFKWIFIIVTLLISVEILGLDQFAVLLTKFIDWLPSLVVAVAIFIVAVVIADIAEKITRVSVEKMKIGFSRLAGAIVKWSIWVFAVLAILMELGGDAISDLIMTLFTGLVVTLTIAFGLAFGLGGKDLAAEILQGLKNKFRK